MAFTLLNTRPAHQANALSKRILAHNGQVIACPSIEIEWLSQSNDTSLNLFNSADKILFTSVNAVQGFLKSAYYKAYLKTPQSIALYAIGRATQQSGLEHGLPLTVLSQTQFDSESLLAHPIMQTVDQQTIVIVKGQGGRTLLETCLQERGASVKLLELYRRVPAPFCEQNWQQFAGAYFPILLVTSVESFDCLWRNLIQWDADYAILDHPKWAFLKVIIVFSQRIKIYIQSQGFTHPIRVVASQSDEGIVQEILAIDSL